MISEKTQKVLALRERGMSYNDISAATGIPVGTVRSYCNRYPSADISLCLKCGTPVKQTAHRKQKKFCSDACRMAWWNAHPEKVKRKAVYHFTCPHCGREFESYGNDHRVFCSRLCYANARSKGVSGNA